MKSPLARLAPIGAALLVSTSVLPAAAQFAKPEDAVKYRKSGMTMMSTHFGRVAAMASGRVPFDAKVAADNAEVAAMLSKVTYAGFVDGSDKGDTRAEPKIWTEKDKFNAAAGTLQEAMAKLNVAAKAGNLDAIKAAVGDVGKGCKSCHDTYRKD